MEEATTTAATSETSAADPIVESTASSPALAEADVAQQVIDDPSASKAEKKEAKKALEKFNLKVHGKEYVEEIDLTNKAELTKRFQKAAAADRNMAEASEIRKAALQFIQELKANPRKVLSDPTIGVDVKKFAEEIMNEALKDMEKTPEQLEREKLQKELEDIKATRDKEKKEYNDREFQRLQQEHERKLEVDIAAALDVGGLPKTPRTVRLMADYMIEAVKNNIDIPVANVAQIVKEQTMTEFKELINSLSDDQLDDFLGKEVLGRVRKKYLAKAKPIESANSVKSTGEMKKPVDVPQKKLTIREVLGV